MRNRKDLIIAIDGYSSGGKSTFAKTIARKLGLTYADSGAMYRAVALFSLEQGLVREAEADREGIIQKLDEINIELRFNQERNRQETWLNGQNVEDKIRGVEVSEWASTISAIPEVRQAMVKLQRKFSENKGVVMDGRDIGTVVFPEADIKIFLTADPEVRARRRFDEMMENGLVTSFEEVLENIKLRDHQDSTRDASPLKRADDTIDLDNSDMTLEEQMEWFEQLLEKLGKN